MEINLERGIAPQILYITNAVIATTTIDSGKAFELYL